jgi:UDPglucose--hexose-1-phosphate uridylyltransferase
VGALPRYPYEAWIAPRRQTDDFSSMTAGTRDEVARALLTVLRKYDALWGTPFPYVMAWYQTPRAEAYRGTCHLHAELFPSYRMPGRLKYLAGTEIAAGMFANDTLPEEKAAELQAVRVTLD